MSRAKRIRRREHALNVAIKKLVAEGILQGRREDAEQKVAEARALIASIQADVASVP